MWIIDFRDMPIQEAALYEAPFEYVKEHVAPERATNRDAHRRRFWWQHGRSGAEMRTALTGLSRYLATPRLTKHRLFVWLPKETLPDSQVIVFARDDDYFLGVLQSSVHEPWALRLGTQLETRPRYTPTTTFETFPFPEATEEARTGIAEAAQALDKLRSGWLDPPGLSETELHTRTLTNLYNQRPSWLAQAHERLDRAVHAAYGWDYPAEYDDILARLVELNMSRAARQELTSGLVCPDGAGRG